MLISVDYLNSACDHQYSTKVKLMCGALDQGGVVMGKAALKSEMSL